MNYWTKLILLVVAATVAFTIGAKMEKWMPSSSPAASAAFTPDPEILRHAEEVKRTRPWLVADSTDWAASLPGMSPQTTILWSAVEPVIVKENETWKITFKTKL
jgi:hypothetical protein